MLRTVRNTKLAAANKSKHFQDALDRLVKKGAKDTRKHTITAADAERFKKWEKLTPEQISRVSGWGKYGKHGKYEKDFGKHYRKINSNRPNKIKGDDRVHAHHIVMKDDGNTSAVGRKFNNMSKDILAKHDIDWYASGDNLTWARNRGFNHDDAYAKAVHRRLSAADARGGRAAVQKELSAIGSALKDGKVIQTTAS